MTKHIDFNIDHLIELKNFIKYIGEAQFCLGPTDRTAIVESIDMMLALSKGGLIGPDFHFELKP